MTSEIINLPMPIMDEGMIIMKHAASAMVTEKKNEFVNLHYFTHVCCILTSLYLTPSACEGIMMAKT